MIVCRLKATYIQNFKKVLSSKDHMAIGPGWGRGSFGKRPPEQRSPSSGHRSSHRGLEPDPSGPSQAELVTPHSRWHFSYHGGSSSVLRAHRKIVWPSIQQTPKLSLSLPPITRGAPGADTGGTEPAAERRVWMAEHRGGRGGRRRGLCSRGGMRKCPRSVSNLSEGGQATFSRRGKGRQSRSSHTQTHRQARGCSCIYICICINIYLFI